MDFNKSAARTVLFILATIGGLTGATAQERPDRTGADSLYREARQLLNRRDYERAVQLFRQVQTRDAASEYAAQSAYWEAYSLYRLGGNDRLREAMAILEHRLQAIQEGSRQEGRDMAELRARIAGMMATAGDAYRYEQLREQAGAPDGCDRDDIGVRMEALRALARLDAERALPRIRQILQNHDECTVPLRRQAVMLVPEIAGSVAAESLMIATTRADPNTGVQAIAVAFLGTLGTRSALDFLAETATSHPNERVREQAVIALTQADGELASEILRSIVTSPSASNGERARAIAGLGRSETNTAFLKDLYATTPSLESRLQILQTIAMHNRGAENAWLLGIARDTTSDFELRRRAVFFAAQGDADLSHLIEMYRTERDPALKDNLLLVMAQYQARDPRALDIIIDVARNGEEPNLRRRAISWLAQSDSPRAAAVLEELLGQRQ